jgi:hypothetical protein
MCQCLHPPLLHFTLRPDLEPRSATRAALILLSLLVLGFSAHAGGMANIVADPSSICHGILHLVTEKEFAVLKEIESNYETVQVP